MKVLIDNKKKDSPFDIWFSPFLTSPPVEILIIPQYIATLKPIKTELLPQHWPQTHTNEQIL